ncbi:MAG: hypothetical protein P4L51_09110 [Puia sp.]|nr:hypothetical protein [Puia sp.]
MEDFVLPFLVRKPAKTPDHPKVLILLHGVGSNEEDLFRFADRFPDYIVLSPRGRYILSLGRYAWYQVGFSTGKPVINEEQERRSRELLLQFVRQARQEYRPEEIFLGGFSQGAIMSYSIGLTHPEEIDGILALSGRILAEIKPFVKKSERLQRLRVFIAHGLHDTTLPVSYAREAREYLLREGITPGYHEYNTGHQIDERLLTDLVDWLP